MLLPVLKRCRSATGNGRGRMHGVRAGRQPTHGRYMQEAGAEHREVRVQIRAVLGWLRD